jgi:hypothetical protein
MEQVAAIYFAAGIVCSVLIVKATKSYTWLKGKVAKAHRKLDAMEGEVPESLNAQYKAVKEAVAAADAAMEDDKIDAFEAELIVNKAVAAVKSLAKLVKA